MPITNSRNVFTNTHTLNILKTYTSSDTSISGFLLVESSINNFEYEYDEVISGKNSYWNKPRFFDKYCKKNNILLIVNNKCNKVYIFIQDNSDYPGRKHWQSTRSKHGIVELKFIGILNISKSDIADVLSYKQFPKHGSSQKINCDYTTFINNLNKKLRINI